MKKTIKRRMFYVQLPEGEDKKGWNVKKVSEVASKKKLPCFVIEDFDAGNGIYHFAKEHKGKDSRPSIIGKEFLTIQCIRVNKEVAKAIYPEIE